MHMAHTVESQGEDRWLISQIRFSFQPTVSNIRAVTTQLVFVFGNFCLLTDWQKIIIQTGLVFFHSSFRMGSESLLLLFFHRFSLTLVYMLFILLHCWWLCGFYFLFFLCGQHLSAWNQVNYFQWHSGVEIGFRAPIFPITINTKLNTEHRA